MYDFEHKARFVARLPVGRPPLALRGPECEATWEPGTHNLSYKNRPQRVRNAERVGDVASEIQALCDNGLRCA